jgi:hypothetical protein
MCTPFSPNGAKQPFKEIKENSNQPGMSVYRYCNLKRDGVV